MVLTTRDHDQAQQSKPPIERADTIEMEVNSDDSVVFILKKGTKVLARVGVTAEMTEQMAKVLNPETRRSFAVDFMASNGKPN